MNELIIPLIAIICGAGLPVIIGGIIGFQYLINRNRERIAMIEKGIVPDAVERPARRTNRYPALRNGLVMIGFALGAMLGILMGPVLVIAGFIDFTVLIMAVMFGGIAFVVYFFLSRKMEEQEREKEERRLEL